MNKTPHILFLMILGFFIVEPSNATANAFSPQSNSGDTISKAKKDKFDGWTEEQYKHYEDSIIFKLYSPVIACKSEAPPSTSVTRDNAVLYGHMPVQNSHVPNTINIDKSKEVGEIPINSGILPSGAKTYEIPITVYPVKYGKLADYGQIYRRGSVFMARSSGITLGNEVSVKLTGYVDYDKYLLQHEIGHIVQIDELDILKFYSRTATEYTKHIFNGGWRSVYTTPGTLEFYADRYAFEQLGYYYNSNGKSILFP